MEGLSLSVTVGRAISRREQVLNRDTIFWIGIHYVWRLLEAV